MFKKAVALLTTVCTVASMSCAALAGTLKVTVHDRESNPLEGADVTATVGGSQAGRHTESTDSDGVATITISESVTDGKVGAGKIGYTSPPSQPFTLGLSDTKEITIVLIKEQTDAEKIDDAKNAVSLAMETFSVSNSTTENDVLNAAKAAVTDPDIEVTVTGFSLTPATTAAAGSVLATVNLRLNGANNSYNLTKEIAKIDAGKTDAEKVQESIAAITSKMAAFTVSNDTTESDVLNAVQSVVTDAGIQVAIDSFVLKPATADTAGEVRASIRLQLNSKNSTYELIKEIAKIDAGKTDAEKIAEAKTAVASAMGNFTVSNSTIMTDILDAAKMWVTDVNIQVNVTDFVLTPATADAAGSVQATIHLKLNSAQDSYKFTKEIAKTGPVPDDQTLADAQTKAAAAVNSMTVSNSTLSSDILKAVQNAVNNSRVSVTWDADNPFNRLAATATAKGRITGKLILSYNNDTAVVSIDREIARLTPSGKYKITMKSTTGGRAYADADTANSGEAVSVSAEPNSGYTFDYWTASENVTFGNKSSQYTRFTMTDKDVTVTAHFRKKSSSGGGNDKEEKNDSIYGDGSGSYRDNSSSSRTAASSPKNTVNPSTASQTAKTAIDKAIDKAVSSDSDSAHASVNFRNVQTMTPDAFKAVVSTMNAASDEVDVHVTVQLDTVVNGAVAARLYVDPKAAAKLDAPIVTTVDTSEKSVTNTAVSKLFDKYFENDVKVVTFGQKGEFGMPVSVAVKVDLTKLDVENLMFYHYDIATNSYSLIEAPAFFIDNAGYVHFTTEKGGSLIITDRALTAR